MKYSKKVHAQIVSDLKDGIDVEQCAKNVGIRPRTFYNWIDRYPKFATDVKPLINKPGRPTEFTESVIQSMLERIPSLYSKGESDAEVAVALDMSLYSFNTIRAKNAEFSAAVEKGRTVAEAIHNKLGRALMIGAKKGNGNVWKFVGQARFGHAERKIIQGDSDNPLVTKHDDKQLKETMTKIMGHLNGTQAA